MEKLKLSVLCLLTTLITLLMKTEGLIFNVFIIKSPIFYEKNLSFF